jgi:hypothetical protein
LPLQLIRRGTHLHVSCEAAKPLSPQIGMVHALGPDAEVASDLIPGGHSMKNPLAHRLRSLSLIIVLVCACRPGAEADPVLVHHTEGTLHGFLEIRSEDGRVVASGEFVQVLHGGVLTSHTIYHFKDGSFDDETAVFSQHRIFQLITDHHIQKGPSFPHPMDVLIDTSSGQVTIRSTGRDGKEEVKTDHLNLPPDLANGIVPHLLENMRPGDPATEVSMLVASPKPRLVKLAISSLGEETCSLVGSPLKVIHDEIKISLGGVAGVVAPAVRKQPPDIQIWITSGPAPTFVKEQGPIYPEGPMMTIQLASPVWPDASKSAR